VKRVWPILWFPFAILLLAAAAIFLAVALYLRVAFAIVCLPWDWLRRSKPEPPKPPYQEPHLAAKMPQNAAEK